MQKKKKQIKNKIKHCTLFVDGMHCTSCEILIEKKLLKLKGIEAVDASLKNNKVDIRYTGENKPGPEAINPEFDKFGYKFSYKKFKKKSVPLLQIKNGGLAINPQKSMNLLKAAAVFVSLLIAFYTIEGLQLGQYVSVDSSSTLPAFFFLGLVAGTSSCAALIGGLLLSMTRQWNEMYIDAETNYQKTSPHIMFHFGRLASFALLGGVLGIIGESISLGNTTIFALLTIFVSIIMLLLALQMLGVVSSFTLPKSLGRFAADESNFRGKYMPFAIGSLTFFLPCGFTLIAQTLALTSGSFVQGLLIMLFFALGTFPILLGISLSGITFNSKPHLTAKFNLIAGLVIVFFAIYNINGQLNVLGYTSLSDFSLGGGNSASSEVAEINELGEQIINITARGFEYIPESPTTITAGVDTTLVVDNKGIQGCGSFIAARGLINNYVALKSGVNRIDIGKPSRGDYKLTCSMGMVEPVNIKVI